MTDLEDAPGELRASIQEFFPPEEWEHAASVARLESGFNAFAIADTTDSGHPCGAVIGEVNGVLVTAEYSVGYFQINACNLPADWRPGDLVNARHNCGTAHMLWERAGRSWRAVWYFSAVALGLT